MTLVDYFIVPVIDALCVVIAFAVLAKSSKKESNIVFSGLVLSIAGWVTFAFLSDLTKNQELSLTYNRIVFLSLAALGSLLLHLSLIFPEKNSYNRLTIIASYSLSAVFALISVLTPLIVSGVVFEDFGSDLVFGSAYNLFLFFLFINFLASGYNFIVRYVKSSGKNRSQLQIFFFGILSVVVVNLFIYYLINPIVGSNKYYRIGNYSSILFVLATAYSMVAKNLFEIRVIATGVAVLGINIALIAQIFVSRTSGETILKVIIELIVMVGSYMLVKNVSQEIARRHEVEGLAKEKTEALTELSERNRNLATLQRISDIVLNESEMKIMAQKILDEIPKQLDSCAGALLSIVKDSQLMAYAVSKHQSSAKILSLVGGDLAKYSFPVKKAFNLSHAVLVDKDSHDSDSLSDFISPPIPKTVALTIQKLIGARHIEAFPLYAGGEPFGVLMFVFTDSKDLIHEQNHSIAKAISDDMSLAIQRAQAYTKLKEANAYLADLDKLKDEFISMASHELNTPLAAIEGYLSMVLDEGLGKVDPKAKEYLNRAYDSSKRLAELILDLLNVSRIEQGRLKMKFTKTNFASLVDSVIRELQLKADTKKLYLKLEAPSTDLPQTFCDPDRIREVFVNLIGNSIKFTDKGGITIRLSHPDDHIRAEIIDTGRGIAAEDQKLLFQKFSQVKREIDEHQGTGLGLYISKNFVELHKGRIGVESEVGKGAKFFFEIPVMKSSPKEVAGAILDKPVNAAQIESGPKGVPAIVTESSKNKA